MQRAEASSVQATAKKPERFHSYKEEWARDQLQETSHHCARQHGFSKSSNDTHYDFGIIIFCGFLVDIQFELTLKVRDCSFLGK